MEPQLVIAGEFGVAGSTRANNIAMWHEPSREWEPLGKGLGDPREGDYVMAMLGSSIGDLYAGGRFWLGGLYVDHIVRWDGVAWVQMGEGLDGEVRALAEAPNGTIVVGGEFQSAGGQPAKHIATWDGSTWQPIDSGLAETVHSLDIHPTLGLIAGTSSGIWRWDGVQWMPLGMPTTGWVKSIVHTPTGELFAGGYFDWIGSEYVGSVARWDGSSWKAVGGGVEAGFGSVTSLLPLGDGSLVVAGRFSKAGGVSADSIARWDGQTWSAYGTGVDWFAMSLASLPNGNLVVGGELSRAGDEGVADLARWDGQDWQPFGQGQGFDDYTLEVIQLADGRLVAGGAFHSAGGRAANCVAMGVGGEWTNMGDGFSDQFDPPDSSAFVYALAELTDSSVVAGGAFAFSGTKPMTGVARWDGAQWQSMGSGTKGWVAALLATPNAGVFAGGSFAQAGGQAAKCIAHWDGAVWSPLGTGLAHTSSYAHADDLAFLDGGNLIVAGQFTHAGGVPAANIARWDGANWSPLGSGLAGPFSNVKSIVVLPDQSIIAAGRFQINGQYARVAKWDGQKWTALGSSIVKDAYCVTALPDGTIFAGGLFEPVFEHDFAGIARWSGEKWVMQSNPLNDPPLSVITTQSGDLLCTGGFLYAGDKPSPYFATMRCTPPCYPDCDGSKSLTIDDFICFQTLYALADPKADCDQSGGLDIDDFICFQSAYALGC